MRSILYGVLVVLIAALFPMTAMAEFNVNIRPPEVGDAELQELINAAADVLVGLLQDEPQLQPFTDQPKLAKAFANAGAASSHVGTIRAFNDFRRFALVVGTGLSAASPELSLDVLDQTIQGIEDEGDIYFGAAVQPINVALGVNISRWLDRSRAFVKVGFIPEINMGGDSTFASTSIGLGLNYKVLESRQLPLGIIRWRGLTAGTAILYQQNTTRLSIDTGGNNFSTPVKDPNDNNLGDLVIGSQLVAEISSNTVTIPLEVSTGLRLLWGLDVNAGAGVDVTFGRSEVSLGSSSTVNFVPTGGTTDTQLSAGTANIGISTSSRPDFVRPRITGGFGLNLGPVKVDVPLMYYLDSDSTGFVGGLNVGIVW